jgi:jumonji domain-containing protein 7
MCLEVKHTTYQFNDEMTSGAVNSSSGCPTSRKERVTIFTVIDESAIQTLSDDVGSLWCRPVAILDSPPDAFTFLRDFVHPNVPCIIRNAILSNVDDGDDMKDASLTLTLDDVIDHVGEDTMLTVDVTPDGHGDCVRKIVLETMHDDESESAKNNNITQPPRRMFVKPYEQLMDIKTFRDLLRKSSSVVCDNANNNTDLHELHLRHHSEHVDIEDCDTETFLNRINKQQNHPPVVYYSRQNDCLRTEMKKLYDAQLFPSTFTFAEEAFGTGPPDAINIWIGNERSVSSMHKDHYENLFYVCSGQKEFVLCPPSDVLFLNEEEFQSGTFCPAIDDDDGSSWVVVAYDKDDDNDRKQFWIEPDILNHCESKFPLLKNAHPIKVSVCEGEMLYIPSLWYHRVTQTCETVGVNYWYDMKFDNPNWCYFNFLKEISSSGKLKYNS